MSQGLPAESPRIATKAMVDHRQREPATLPTTVTILLSGAVTLLPYLFACPLTDLLALPGPKSPGLDRSA